MTLRITPLTRRRWANFRAHRRGYWSLWIFLTLFMVSLCAELVANDKPLFVWFKGSAYAPVLVGYPETVVLDRKGRIAATSRGVVDDQFFVKEVQPLLKEQV